MKKRYWSVFISILVFFQLILNQSDFLSWLHMVLIFGWLTVYFFGPQFGSMIIVSIGMIYELLSFNYIGTYALSFSVGLLFVFVSYKYMNFSDKSYRVILNIIGLVISTLVYYIINYFLNGSINLVDLILSIGFGLLIFYLLSRLNKQYRLISEI